VDERFAAGGAPDEMDAQADVRGHVVFLFKNECRPVGPHE
jgi:hypothetical protein